MPAGWLEDEPLLVPDPSAEAPADWDDEEDGEWEAPVWMRRPFLDASTASPRLPARHRRGDGV